MKVKNHIYMLFMLLVTFLLPTSCNDHNELCSNSDADGEKIQLKIGVSLSGTSKSETRGFGDEGTGPGGYYEFSDLYVAVFVDIDGVSYLDEFVKADNTAPTWNTENQCWTFGVSLTKTTDARRLHIIANYPGLTMGFGEEGQLIGRMLANGENHDVYWNCCDVNKIDTSDNGSNLQTKLQKIPLLRNYVKVVLEDNRTNKTNFVLDGYALYNVPTKGTVAPYHPSGINKFANFVTNTGQCQSYTYLLETEQYEGNEPFDDGTLISTDLEWMDIKDGVIPPAYIYERSNRTATNPTCMLIKGRYNSEGNITASTSVTYYKLDFVYEDDATDAKIYYNLLRNFIYTMSLNSVKGAGYNTIEEAITQPASNNIGGDAVAKDYTNISDGTNQLFVSTTYMMLTSNREAYLYYKYIKGTTISNGEVTITAPAGNVLSIPAERDNNNETDGLYADWRRVTLTPRDVTSVSQSQELIFAVGDLQRKVELVLRQPYRLTVQTPDEVTAKEKEQLNVIITLPSGIAPSLFPLRLFISSEDNTIYPDYGTNMPAEAQGGKYGFIKEISLDEYNASTSKVFTCKFLTNCKNNETTVHVDNEYFARGSDSFTNPWKNNITLNTAIKVEIQKTQERYPQNIYGSNGRNNGTEEVSVTLNGINVGTITIDRDNVTKGITFTGSEDFSQKDVVEFTFTDKYYWNNQWSTTPITYKATSTLGEIDAGTTLKFAAQFTSLFIPTSQKVSIPKDGNIYPYNIYNNGNNNGTEVVIVTLNGTNVGTITVDRDNVTQGITITKEEGLDSEDVLTFTFSDRYYKSSGSGKGWQNAVTYTATYTIEELLSGNITLTFAR